MADDSARVLGEENLRTRTQTKAFLLRAILEGKKRRKRLQTILHTVVARRKFLLNLCIIGLLLSLSRKIATPHHNRSCRRLARNVGWFDMIWTKYSDARFKKTFRISRATYQFLLQRIRHVLDRETVTEEPISAECRLAICLYRLARGNYYYTIAEMTGLGVSTVCTIVNEVTRAIVNNLWDECVGQHLPRSQEHFKERYLIWRNSGSFVVVGLPSMDAIYPSNARLEALRLKNITTSKTFTP